MDELYTMDRLRQCHFSEEFGDATQGRCLLPAGRWLSRPYTRGATLRLRH
jgi:hypothetical protein